MESSTRPKESSAEKGKEPDVRPSIQQVSEGTAALPSSDAFAIVPALVGCRNVFLMMTIRCVCLTQTSSLPSIDMETFNQIIDLDEDDETYDFSWGMAWAYFSQAKSTFEEMNQAL